jgi:serine/threonine-protein kinase
MAPEQWESPVVDHRADLYGLGCTLFCLLTGKPPFAELTQGSWVELVTGARLRPPPSARVPGQDAVALTGLVARLLAKNPTAPRQR